MSLFGRKKEHTGVVDAFNTRAFRAGGYSVAAGAIVLAIAVLDEYVQSLVGRTGIVADVLFDFAGASFGIVVAVIVMALVLRRARR